MGIYNPDPVFFKKQLISLNEQTYQNIKLIFLDDASSDFNAVRKAIENTITRFTYRIHQNERNLGVNCTYEKLTSLCDTDYIAYCDQDDIWLNERIEKGVEKLKKANLVLTYSDLSIIDQNDIKRHESFTHCRKRVVHRSGGNVWPFLVQRCSVTGCTILMRTAIAKQAIPFPDKRYTWDHWVSIIAALNGVIGYDPEPLVRYRIHGGNQIGLQKLTGILSKTDYIEKNLSRKADLYGLLIPRVHDAKIKAHLRREREHVIQRMAFMENPSWKRYRAVLRLLFKDVLLFLFETAMVFDHKRGGSRVIRFVKRTKY